MAESIRQYHVYRQRCSWKLELTSLAFPSASAVTSLFCLDGLIERGVLFFFPLAFSSCLTDQGKVFKKKVFSYGHKDKCCGARSSEWLPSLAPFQRSPESEGFSSGFDGWCEASLHLTSMNVNCVSKVFGVFFVIEKKNCQNEDRGDTNPSVYICSDDHLKKKKGLIIGYYSYCCYHVTYNSASIKDG